MTVTANQPWSEVVLPWANRPTVPVPAPSDEKVTVTGVEYVKVTKLDWRVHPVTCPEHWARQSCRVVCVCDCDETVKVTCRPPWFVATVADPPSGVTCVICCASSRLTPKDAAAMATATASGGEMRGIMESGSG